MFNRVKIYRSHAMMNKIIPFLNQHR